jgi:protein disulfide-isomerase A6
MLRLFTLAVLATTAQAQKTETFKQSEAGVVAVTRFNVDALMHTYDYVMINFCADWKGACKTQSEEMEKAALKLKADGVGDDVVVAYVNLTQAKTLGRKFDVTKVPQLKMFVGKKNEAGHSEVSWKNYKGETDADAIVSHLKAAKEGKDHVAVVEEMEIVTDVTSDNFEKLVMEDTEHDVLLCFSAPWCGHCKKLAPDYVKLATLFKEKVDTVRFMKVDASVHKIGELHPGVKVEGYPALLLFNADDKQNPVMHERRPAMKQITQFLMDKASKKFDFDLTAFGSGGAPKVEKPAAEAPTIAGGDEDFDL